MVKQFFSQLSQVEILVYLIFFNEDCFTVNILQIKELYSQINFALQKALDQTLSINTSVNFDTIRHSEFFFDHQLHCYESFHQKKPQKVHRRIKTEKQLTKNSCVFCLYSILPHLLLPSFPLLSACYLYLHVHLLHIYITD